MSKKEAKEILKSKYGIDNKNPDENIRFILGKCNPVLLVPGIYATKLKVEFNCSGLATEEKKTTLKNIRIYCGNDVCKNETKTSEEHPFLFSVLDKAFWINALNANKYGACLGHKATYFQNENDCPENLCYYSKYIKVGYYGGTTDTLNKSRCGAEGIINVIQTSLTLTTDSGVSFFVKVADAFKTISKNLIKKGYNFKYFYKVPHII